MTVTITRTRVSYFNPRPREEGDQIKCAGMSQESISIHALVKRATPIGVGDNFADEISIHALVKRATQRICHALLGGQYFNPRPREEGDSPSSILLAIRYLFQSTPS